MKLRAQYVQDFCKSESRIIPRQNAVSRYYLIYSDLRGGSRTPATPNMEFFATSLNGTAKNG